MSNPDRYAVFGNPIEHSLSPAIHALFAEQTGEDIAYDAQLVAVDDFDEAVRRFCEAGGRGLNITVPFKESAFKIASRRSPRAERAGAVNTLVLHSAGNYFGDTTDGIGLARDLIQNLGLSLTDRKLLILGAGGAVRGVLEPLLGNRPSQLTIANRTVEKALQLAEHFADAGNINGCGFDDLEHQSFDIIINATSASLHGQMPDLPEGILSADSFCYDMMYGKGDTVFMQWAMQRGCDKVCDGLGMLIEQAAESFSIWRGVAPETDGVIRAIRERLQD